MFTLMRMLVPNTPRPTAVAAMATRRRQILNLNRCIYCTSQSLQFEPDSPTFGLGVLLVVPVALGTKLPRLASAHVGTQRLQQYMHTRVH